MTAIDPTTDIFAEIERLKRERKAVILAHYYQDPDIQDIADHLGDSLDLARKAEAEQEAEVILFCGVHFMAETAKILNPSKTVILPDLEAGCSLADSCPADQLRAWKAKHPEHLVVSYINCTAAVKAESHIICTSSNAQKVIDSLPADKPILFAPDANLGRWLVKETGRQMDLRPGSCIVHETFSERAILDMKARTPGALFIAHPECEEHVLRHADFVGSTRKLLEYVQTDVADTFIVGTETGILHTMKQAAPEKTLLDAPFEDAKGACASCNECPHMKRNTLEKIRDALANLSPRIEMDEDLRQAAWVPLKRMLDLA